MKSMDAPNSRSLLLVFDKGDDFLATLTAFVEEHGIRGGHFVALGAFSSATIAWWNPVSKQYEKRAFDEQMEVLSLVGDVTVSPDGVTRLHAHVTLDRSDLDAIGGHVMAATVFPTLEMHVVDFGKAVIRDRDPQTGLLLINL